MRVIQINTVVYGSTGKIALGIKNLCGKSNIQCQIASRYPDKNIEDGYFVSSWLDCHIHNRLSRYTMLQGCFSFFHTLFFLRKLSKYKPEIILLHNLHGSYINFPLLFHYIKRQNIPVVWTLHDCWAFTGHCPYFTMVKCNKWKTGCGGCPQLETYPKARIDNTKFSYKLKKKLLSGVEDMTLVTPSQWLADLVKQSFLGSLSEQEMCSQYLKANVFVSASTIENSPNSVGEAMLVGCPVVSSDVGGVKNMLEHGKEGFVYQSSAPYMLAYYVNKIFEDDNLALEFSKNAREHANKTHNREINMNTLHNIYDEIVKNSGGWYNTIYQYLFCHPGIVAVTLLIYHTAYLQRKQVAA